MNRKLLEGAAPKCGHGAITPEEIAMSILAEITIERRRGSARQYRLLRQTLKCDESGAGFFLNGETMELSLRQDEDAPRRPSFRCAELDSNSL
jgi:hypothetical protein